ncbi:hypothetical protein D2E26_1166 [Bifidobacterium dolichotidis]|uniref:Uncharacterized protein n=1 Tax=Bifidobacterium dolichotidis TaxID=2306976 RepID=A0A430FQJ2_9BIFI|nr:hypothetical protein D2E26_1166 [Bifidobacterium dolichotidis]
MQIYRIHDFIAHEEPLHVQNAQVTDQFALKEAKFTIKRCSSAVSSGT